MTAETEAEALGVSDQTNVSTTDASPTARRGRSLSAPADVIVGISALGPRVRVTVIGARAGGLPEVVRDGVTGALRDVGEVREVAAAGISCPPESAGNE